MNKAAARPKRTMGRMNRLDNHVYSGIIKEAIKMAEHTSAVKVFSKEEIDMYVQGKI